MTGPGNRHELWEELVSASLHGDLTLEERRRLDAHLDGCERCRATLAAFADTRRIVAGLRHVAPPRDLGARVRAGIELAAVPWWRRPALMFTAVGGGLAAVTGALLALVILNGTPSEPEVGQDLSPTPTATAPVASVTPEPEPVTPTAAPTLPQPETPAPGETLGPEPTADPSATPNPIAAASPEPDLYVAMTGPADNQALTVVEPETEQPVAEPQTATAIGPPIAAELSSDGGWVAVVTQVGDSGLNQLSATRVPEPTDAGEPSASPVPEPSPSVGESVDLGQTVAGSPFLERLAWAPDGSALAYTLADPTSGATDVWVLESETGTVRQLTDVGDAYAGSWAVLGAETEEPRLALWVSRAAEVTSYLVPTTDESGAPTELIDPGDGALAVAPNVFQPIVSPNGALAIYWSGVMAESDAGWAFVEGGAPYLAEHRPESEDDEPFPNARQLFSDVTVDRDAFTSAAVAWSLDSDTYAVWATEWTGIPQSADEAYPDPARVYFGKASDPRGLTRTHAIDRDDLPADWNVVDVKVSPTGRHLVVTVARPRAGLELPTAELRLITRNTGDVADEVEVLASEEGMWFGPAVFDAFVEIDGEEVEAP